MKELLEQIVSYLDGWEIRHDMVYYNFVNFQKGVATIRITGNRDKLNFRAVFPEGRYTYYTCPKDFKSSINISKSKSFKIIAKSLKKRLIDEYLVELDKIFKKRQQENENAILARNLAKEVTKLLKIDLDTVLKTSSTYYISKRIDDLSCKVEIEEFRAGESAHIKLMNIKKEDLIKIINIIKR